ncbi:mycothiol synthase [Cellulomonas alba]|uniref:Mycothiol acetyltransferase n=1 Tax=Cellulomonas alba TaxID=3053467 RepID=A0ABT7SEL0_9CELL|nr:mycothiol synthase [Cellulomonas alba]MDM7854479.1 mycothiol synthase [Cellulomonas alba]
MPVQVSAVRGPLPTAVADEVRAVAARAAVADGVAPLSEQPLLWLSDPDAVVVHLLARDDDGALVGYAQVDVALDAQATAELLVAPDARRHGTGGRLLAEARSFAAAVHGRPLHVWAHGDLEPARAMTTAAGGVVTRELWRMRLSGAHTDAPPRRPFPAGVTVRTFVPGQDEDAWRRVNARAFARHPEQGRISDADLRAREREPWFDPAGFLLAERDRVLLGFVWTKVHPAGEHGPEPVGELYVVGVDPDAQGLGLGGALTAAGIDHLRSRGPADVILYTDADNAVAVHTYERHGFAVEAVDRMFTFDTAGSRSDDTMGG